MSQIWSCECGNRWRAAGTVRTCPKCGSPKVVAVAEPSAPKGHTSVLPGNAAGNSGDETVARPSLVESPVSVTLPALPVGLSGSVPVALPPGAEVTLDRTVLPVPATGSPHPGGTVQPGTEILERSGARDTSPRSPADPSFATVAAPPSTDGGGDTMQTVGGGSAIKKRLPRARSRMEDYEILGVLGRGGMGVVHKARHVKLDRLVALKMILAGSHAGEAQLNRFQTEAESVAQLQHPNIVQIYDIGEHNGQPFIALEFVDGGSLQQKLDGTPMPPRLAAEMVAVLAHAVDYAHQRGVVHRDLKPANILLAGEWRLPGAEKPNGQEIKRKPSDPPPGARPSLLPMPKITDFGLAKRTTEDAGQTGTGDILGTPSYMSPEQATGKNELVGPPADIYSLGAILYDLLTGRPPFKGETVLDTLQQVQGREPLPPTRIQPKVPRDVETICLKCLQKEPAKRYQTAGQLADDLERFLDYKPIVARPTPIWERAYKWAKRRPAVAALLGTLALTLVSAFVGMFCLWRVAVGERGAAVIARDEAVQERKETQKQRDRAEENLSRALLAGEKQLTKVAEERLLKEPMMEGLRRELLLEALAFFQTFQEQGGGSPKVRYQAARAQYRVGYVQELLGNRAEAKTAYEKAVAGLRDLSLENPRDRDYRSVLGGARNNLASVLRALDQPQQAENQFIAAQSLFTKLVEDYPLEPNYQRELAITHSNFAGLLAQHPARELQARVAYSDSLTLWRKLCTAYPKNRDYQTQLARVLNDFGQFLETRGNREDAEKSFAESVVNWTELANQDRNQPLYADARAGALINLGVVYENLAKAIGQDGDRAEVAALEEKAEAAYREAAAVEEKLVPNWPRVDDYRHNLARSYTRLSLLLVRDPKRIDLAADFRRKAIPHWEKLLDQDPRFADYHVGLIGCFYDEALYQLRIGEKDAAIQWGEKAVKRQETLADGFPKRLDFQVRLARGYNDLGKIYGEKGNAEQEKAHYDLALSKLEGIKAKADAPVTDWSQAMADVNKDIGVMRAIRQDYTQALPSFQKALQHQREALDAKSTYEVKQNLVDLAISTTDLQVKLKDAPGVSATAAEVEPFLREFKWRQGLDLFSLARRVARCIPITDGKDQKKYADQAMRLLEAAVEQGLEAMQALRNPDFSPLFDRVDYQRLLKGKG